MRLVEKVPPVRRFKPGTKPTQNELVNKSRIMNARHHVTTTEMASKSSKIEIGQKRVRIPDNSNVKPVTYLKPGEPRELANS